MSKVIESIPSSGLDFEYCAVQQIETKTFTLMNPSSNLVQFEILTDETDNSAFNVEPKTGKLPFFEISSRYLGMLRAGHKKEITITFAPTEAKVIVSTAVFKFSEGEKTA